MIIKGYDITMNANNSTQLTQAERLYISNRLLSRAKHESRKLLHAERKQRALHPELQKQMKQDIAECMRLAMKLQEPAG